MDVTQFCCQQLVYDSSPLCLSNAIVCFVAGVWYPSSACCLIKVVAVFVSVLVVIIFSRPFVALIL